MNFPHCFYFQHLIKKIRYQIFFNKFQIPASHPSLTLTLPCLSPIPASNASLPLTHPFLSPIPASNPSLPFTHPCLSLLHPVTPLIIPVTCNPFFYFQDYLRLHILQENNKTNSCYVIYKYDL